MRNAYLLLAIGILTCAPGCIGGIERGGQNDELADGGIGVAPDDGPPRVADAGSEGPLSPDAGSSADAGESNPGAPLCGGCQSTADCAEGACLVNNETGERFCGRRCDDASDCPDGFECIAVQGVSSSQCVPSSSTCDEPRTPSEEPTDGGVDDAGPTDAETPEEPAPRPDEPTAGTCTGTVEAELLRITNAERTGRGLKALVCDEKLTRAAFLHSADMCTNGYFSHTGQNGSTPSDRARAQGASFSAIGENIARGQASPADVHAAWMNSDGHRRNILGTGWNRIGLGYDRCGGRPLWTQVFTN